MNILINRSPKSKITVTLSREVVRQLDILCDSTKKQSRSRLVEEAVLQWLHTLAEKEVESRVEDYYRFLSKVERKEDKTWCEASAHLAKHLWDT